MLDDLDRALLHALQIDARAPLSRIGAVLGASPQTVGRRYQRLREHARLRVVGAADPAHTGVPQWFVRLTTTPATALALAGALAKREDTSWVRLTSGGTEIVGIVQAPAVGESLLLRDIPRTAGITAVSAHHLLHLYRGGPTPWPGRPQVLDAGQCAQLDPRLPASTARLTGADLPLLTALAADGRASAADLATATGLAPSTVARRVADLRGSGALYFDLDLADDQLGVGVQALLWMSVAPAHLHAVGTALAGHPELAFVAHTTGTANLAATALCADTAGMHRYLTGRLAEVPGILGIETAPVLHTVKAAGPLRLAP